MPASLDDTSPDAATAPTDHRVEVAARKRALTRTRILDATVKVFATTTERVPVIEDVVREAGISRGSFYTHFRSLEEALRAVAELQSDQFTRDILPVYDVLEAPWQRFSVGFRLFLKRAEADRLWGSFVTGSQAMSPHLLVGACMREDLRRGQALGMFRFNDLEVAVDFMLGANSAGIHTLCNGVPAPQDYIDACVRMALVGLGCDAAVCEQGVRFSREYLSGWRVGSKVFQPGQPATT